LTATRRMEIRSTIRFFGTTSAVIGSRSPRSTGPI
jgi:hypothetical protein